jgi:hypothetical protein
LGFRTADSGVSVLPGFLCRWLSDTGANLGVLAAAFVAGSPGERLRNKAVTAGSAVALCAVRALLFMFVAKGAYFASTLACAVFATGVAKTGERTQPAGEIAMVGFVALAFTAPLVGWHWGGSRAAFYAAAASVAGLLLALGNRGMSRPLWRFTWTSATNLGATAAVLLVALPIAANSYFPGTRFSQSVSSFQARLSHWSNVWTMIEPTWSTRLFGMGVGRFPETYYFKSRGAPVPGSYQYTQSANNTALRLNGPRPGMGGSVLYFGQHLNVPPFETYQLEFDLRATKPGAIEVGLCEKYVLYSDRCVRKGVKVTPGELWQPVSVALESGKVGQWGRLGRKPVQFWLSNAREDLGVEVDNLRLTDARGRNLIANGDFEEGNAHWFFSASDFWPWHIENILLYSVFETGWLGALAFVLLVLLGLALLAARLARDEPLQAMVLAGLLGILTVGMFNSPLDFPRVALLFFLLLWISYLRPVRDPVRGTRREKSRPPSPPEPPAEKALLSDVRARFRAAYDMSRYRRDSRGKTEQ